jgi:hypothetical protein
MPAQLGRLCGRAQLIDSIICEAGRVILETKRLQLAPLGLGLADQLWEIYADPEVARFVGGDSLTPAATREQAIWFSHVWESEATARARPSGGRLGK